MTRHNDEFEARWAANEATIRQRVMRFGLSDDDTALLLAEVAAKMKRSRAKTSDDKAFVLLADTAAFRLAQKLRHQAAADEPVFVPPAGWLEPADDDAEDRAAPAGGVEESDLDDVELQVVLRRAIDSHPENAERGLLEPVYADDIDERHMFELRLAVQQALEGDEFWSLPDRDREAVILLGGGSLPGGTYTSRERGVIHEARKSRSFRRWVDGLLGGLVVRWGRWRERLEAPQLAAPLIAAAAATTMMGGITALSTADADARSSAPRHVVHDRPITGGFLHPAGPHGHEPAVANGHQAAARSTTASGPRARGTLTMSVGSRLPSDDDGYVEVTIVQDALAPLGSTTDAGVTIRCNTPTRALLCEAVRYAQSETGSGPSQRP